MYLVFCHISCRCARRTICSFEDYASGGSHSDGCVCVQVIVKMLDFLFLIYNLFLSSSDSAVLNPLHCMSFYCLCCKEVGDEHPPRAPVGGWVMGRCVC